ncbi:MAG: circularly permuted type 2 ATP-grasp protein [Dehalococcoidia bacterium]|nr:MAG: circularly permuted type 2 ATP-grasp protein [Dehalococcoidia bacterium]
MADLLSGYRTLAGPDEMFAPDGTYRPAYVEFAERFRRWDAEEYRLRQAASDLEQLNGGVTFTVYQDQAGTERIFPFSLIPRIISAGEWSVIEAGLVQRVTALNQFLTDLYGDQRCIRDGVIPAELVESAPGFNARMRGFEPTLGVWAHIAGIDLIRDRDGIFRVLEDNLRTPSGVSYVLENRRTMLNVAPDLFPGGSVAPVDEYPDRLLDMLVAVRPAGVEAEETRAVILTPGSYNSAYFEHSFLARQMGIELVEGRDLLVHKQRVYLRATTGLERVHVIYRRVDDDFLDPLVFRADSTLGVAGLFDAYRAGNVTIVNAIGNGIVDDKVTCRFVPEAIRYYLGQEPIIPNVDTYVGALPSDLEFMLANLGDLVMKPSNASGGYGIVIGPQASAADLQAARERLRANPSGYIAQPLQEFSTIPSFDGERLEPRRADLRPFVVTGSSSWVLPGGLTRVASDSTSYIVNSSQGGGSKDTWVLRQPRGA